MNASYKTIGLWVLLIALFIAFYQVFQTQHDEPAELAYSAFLDQVRDGKVAAVRIKGNRYAGSLKTGEYIRTSGPVADAALINEMRAADVQVEFQPPEEASLFSVILGQWLPVVFLFLFFVFFMRQVKGAAVPRFTAKPQVLAAPDSLRGLDDARTLLRAATDAVKNKQPGPRRLLISGEPGTGKTALVKAAVADSKLKAFVLGGSEFMELYMGSGAKRVRELFEAARKAQPVVVVIEDLDAIAKARTMPSERTHDEREQTLIELCQWLDGIKTFPERVLLIATTNRPDLLDPAILRPGRFQQHLKLTADGATLVS